MAFRTRAVGALLALTFIWPSAAQDRTPDRTPAHAEAPADQPSAPAPASPPATRAPAAAAVKAAPAAPPALVAPPAVSPAEAAQALDVLKDDKKRAAFIATLETLTNAAPAAEVKSPIPLAPDSLGAQLLVGVSAFMDQAEDQLVSSVGTIRSLPSLVNWAEAQVQDPEAAAGLTDLAWRLAVAMLAGLTLEWGARRLLRRPVLALAAHAPANRSTPVLADRHADDRGIAEGEALAEAGQTEPMKRRRASPWTMLRRIPFVLGRLLLDLVPVAAFGVATHLAAGSALGGQNLSRIVLLAVIDAYLLCAVVMCVVRMLFSPDAPRLRLVHMSDKSAAYVVRWVRRLVAVAVFGYALAAAGQLFGLSGAAHVALLKGVVLIDHLFLCVMVVQKRRAVKNWIRAPQGASGAVAAVRNRLAAVWHWIALFYIAALWLVWAVEIRDGYSRMLHTFLLTAAVLIATRLILIVALGSLERARRISPSEADRFPGLDQRLATYHPFMRAVVYSLVAILGALLLLQAWGVGALEFLASSRLGQQIVSASATVGVTLAVAVLVWEAVNNGIQRELARLSLQGQAARAARLRTLLPMLRTALMLTILTVVTLTVLSEIGINIAPLLAGAGVLGIAVGFGSQKLVQDVITGLFLLLENTMQVGDIVSLGGLTGVVENLSIRAIRLRAEDGSVHVIPFSAVTTVTNMTRDYSHAVIEAQVAYEDDYDAVVAVLRDIVREMRAEPRWASEVQDDLEVWGINKFADNSMMLKARIKCGPFGRWAVGREFNRRMRARFDARGGPDAMRLLLPRADNAEAPQPRRPETTEASPEAKLSAEAKKADAEQTASRLAASHEIARDDEHAADVDAKEAAE